MMSRPDFEPGTPCTPTKSQVDESHRGQASESQQFHGYEGLQCNVIESCLMSPCIGADWSSIFLTVGAVRVSITYVIVTTTQHYYSTKSRWCKYKPSFQRQAEIHDDEQNLY